MDVIQKINPPTLSKTKYASEQDLKLTITDTKATLTPHPSASATV